MARFDPGPLGRVTGQVGNVVFRRMSGKYFLSVRPEHYKASQTEEAKISRNGFGICVKFAKTLAKIPNLAVSWKAANLKGSSAYHRILKHNLLLTRKGRLSAFNIITPEGFNSPVSAIDLQPGSLKVTFSNQKLTGDINVSEFKIILLVFMTSPLTNSVPKENLKVFESEVDLSISDILVVNFSDTDKKLFSEYKDFIVYASVVWIGEANKIQWSSSSAKEFNLPV